MTRTAAGPQAQLVQGKRSWPAGTANCVVRLLSIREKLVHRHSYLQWPVGQLFYKLANTLIIKIAETHPHEKSA